MRNNPDAVLAESLAGIDGRHEPFDERIMFLSVIDRPDHDLKRVVVIANDGSKIEISGTEELGLAIVASEMIVNHIAYIVFFYSGTTMEQDGPTSWRRAVIYGFSDDQLRSHLRLILLVSVNRLNRRLDTCFRG